MVLAGLGAVALTISSAQHATLALDIGGARAYQAARAGSEWGIYQLLASSDPATAAYRSNCQAASYAAASSAPPTTAALQSLTGLAATLSSYTVTVACGSGGAAYSEGGNSVWVYLLEATACNQPHAGACPNSVDPDVHYVERRLRLTISD